MVLIVFLLVIAIIFSAWLVVTQVFSYRHDYRTYTKMIRERDKIMVTRGQLLIEQQTFGATPQIGTRAVTQLRMFSPPATQTVVMTKKSQ